MNNSRIKFFLQPNGIVFGYINNTALISSNQPVPSTWALITITCTVGTNYDILIFVYMNSQNIGAGFAASQNINLSSSDTVKFGFFSPHPVSIANYQIFSPGSNFMASSCKIVLFLN